MRAYLLGGRPVFFPFLSGILRYDCPTCDAPCCKGAALGIGVSRELVTIQQVQPRAALFAVPQFHHSSILALQTPAERCWFLDRKNRCRIERVMGRDAKPAGCRLFPFVRFRSLGEAIAVLPDFTCPITIADAPSQAGPTSHDEIALEMHRAQIPRNGHPELAAPRDIAWEDAVLLERKIVEESERHLEDTSYVDFAELQHQLALAALGVEGRSDAMERVDETARRFMGAAETPTPRAIKELIALTGVLRVQASALPRREVPGVLVALSVLLGVTEGMRGSVRSARTAPSILETQLPLLYALANLGARPMVRAGVSLQAAVRELPPVRAPLFTILEQLEKNGRRNVADTLEDILRREPAFAPPLTAEATAMMHALGRVLLRACTFVPL